MQRNYSWLEIAEYLSIIASMIGSIAAVATQKAVLMAAPMSMSLMLNLLHRRKLLHLSRQRIGAEVTEQCQEISDRVALLKTSVLEEIPTQTQLKQAIATLPLEQIESCLVQLCQKVEHQQIEISQLMMNLEKFSHQLPSNLTTLPTEINEIKAQLNPIHETKESSVEREISSIKTELARVAEKLSQLHQDGDSLMTPKKLKQMIAAIKSLHQENLDSQASITQLNEAVNRISTEQKELQNLFCENLIVSTNPNSQCQEQFNNCLQQISDLRGSLAELTRAIALLETQTEQIIPQPELRSLISDLIKLQLQESTTLQPSMIGQSLSNGLSPNCEEIKGGDNGFHQEFHKLFDFSSIPQLHREIENLSEEIATLEAQMENRLAPLEAIDRHAIEEDLSLQGQAIAQLQQQASKLLKFYEGDGDKTGQMSSKIDRVETLLSQLSTQVSELQPKVETELLDQTRFLDEQTLPWTCLHTLIAHGEAVFGLDFSQDGNFLATGSADHTLKIWQVAQEMPIEHEPTLCQTFTGHGHWVRAISIAPHRDFIVSGSADRTIHIWPTHLTEPLIEEPLTTLNGHSLSVRAIAMSPNGQILASGSADQTIQIWPVADILGDRSESLPTPQTVLTGHKAPVDTVAFSSDSQLLASGGVDCSIKIWQMNSQQLLCTLTDHTEPITSVAFSPNPESPLNHPGYLLASGSVDCSIKIWQIHPETAETQVIFNLIGHSEAVTCVKFSPNGQLLASASIDQTIKLWQISPLHGNPALLCTLTGHLEPVLDLAFRGDRTLASCSADGQVKIWHCLEN